MSGTQAHTGGAAATASEAMGAEAYATGNQVAFRSSPDLHTAAHEAAHVIQQRGGVQLADGVGQAGDAYEQHADAVADAVVRGESAAGLLDEMAGGAPADRAVQMQERTAQRDNDGEVREAPPQAGYEQGMEAGDHARSVGEHLTRTALHEAALREMYHRGEQAIAAEAAAMRRAGQSEQAVARWSVEARNNLRRAIREQGEPIVDQIARATRGTRDMPSYESLRARGRTDAQIIESAARSNPGVDRWVGRIRIAGRIFIAVDIGVAAYTVASAPSVDRPRVMAREAGRLGGALAGGWAVAKGGAAAGSFFGPWGTAIGSVIGGIGGAIGGGWAAGTAAEWMIDQFYPPADTRFEEGGR